MILKIMRSAAAQREIDSDVLEFMISEGIHDKMESEFIPERGGQNTFIEL
jgi:hypothetical protein